MRAIIIIFVIALATISAASAYTDTQEAMIQGARLSWDLATATANGDVATFNSLADQWNVWVRTWFGEDANLIVEKMTAPTDLSKPVLLVNSSNSTGGIVHEMDGQSAGPQYTTNDANLLPDRARYNTSTGKYSDLGGQWLGGI